MSNLLAPHLTPYEKAFITGRTKLPPNNTLLQDPNKVVNALIKARTQKLQQAVLDGFLGIDDSDAFRITRMIKKLIDQKPELAVKILTRLLPNLTDADIQRQLPTQHATINIVNNATPTPQAQLPLPPGTIRLNSFQKLAQQDTNNLDVDIIDVELEDTQL